jgi:hypothetical protein
LGTIAWSRSPPNPAKRTWPHIGELLSSGKMTTVIDRKYQLTEVPDAMRYLERGHARGKVIITFFSAGKAFFHRVEIRKANFGTVPKKNLLPCRTFRNRVIGKRMFPLIGIHKKVETLSKP